MVKYHIERGGRDMAAKRPSYTTPEQKAAWQKQNYRKYVISLRYDTDQELIDYLEDIKDIDGRGTTGVIREALKAYINAQKKEG